MASHIDLDVFNGTILPPIVQTAPEVNPAAGLSPRTGAVAGAGDVLGSSGPVVLVEVDADQDGTFEGRPGSLIPDLDGGRIRYVGNAAALGAQLALVSEPERARAARLARAIEHVALATHPDFQDLFVEAMNFPRPS